MSKGTKGMEKDVATMGKGRFEMIWPGDVVASPYQTRKRLVGIEELAQSIRAHGLMNPVTVRVRPGPLGLNNGYELIAGERRWRAFELAFGKGVGVRMPAMVVEVNERTAAELVVTENMQRCDLSPLEEAAGVAALLGTGRGVADIADRLGRTVKWVRRRAKLLDLAPGLKEAVGNPDNGWSLVPVAALELIAALPVEVQVELFDAEFCEASEMGLKDVREDIEGYMRDLAKAPFSVAECGGCTKRTGVAPDLFEGVDSCELGRCLDRGCWDGRRKAAVECLLKEVREREPGVVVFANNYNDMQAHGLPGVPWQAEKRKEDAGKGAVKGYKLVDGELEEVWLPKKEEEDSDRDGGGHDMDGVNATAATGYGEVQQAGPTAVEKLMAVELRKMEAWVRDEGASDTEVRGHDSDGDKLAELLKGKTTLEMLRLAMAFGCEIRWWNMLEGDVYYKNPLKAVWEVLEGVDEDRVAELVADGIRASVRRYVGFERVTGCGRKYREALYVDQVVLGANVMETLDTEVQGHDRDGGGHDTDTDADTDTELMH